MVIAISSLFNKLNKGKWPRIMALFVSGILWIVGLSLSHPATGERQGVLGGPPSLPSADVISPEKSAILRPSTIFEPLSQTAHAASAPEPKLAEGVLTRQAMVVFPPVVQVDSPWGATPTDSFEADGSKVLNGYFIMPAKGFNWGILHNHNAVDIANACGTPIVAAADGLVVPDNSFGDGASGWNGGYGKFVLLEHPNGTRTRYAHLSEIDVSIGAYVKQGARIGLMGETGEATGCHVHFEVYGVKNPFAKN